MAFAIAALGFNLLLGYTGLLSFGHSAYFGVGAYTVAFIVRDLGVHSMELCILGGLLSALVIAGLFGYVCVRHTRIFFGILTLALSQVLWSLAFKFFWVTGGTDGIRVPYNGLTLLGGLIDFRGAGAYQRFIYAYYYYVLVLFGATAGLPSSFPGCSRASLVRFGCRSTASPRPTSSTGRFPARSCS
jgi:branched-chain amino acid transport system permease protein